MPLSKAGLGGNGMLKVKILKTGEIKEVTNNVAHGLIDSGEATLLSEGYDNKMMRPSHQKKYKIK